MTLRSHIRSKILLLAVALLCVDTCAAGTPIQLTMNSEDRQSINGWGLFPFYSHSNWGEPFRSIANRPLVRDKIFDLEVNYIRVELCSNSYDPAGPDKLNVGALDELKTHILMAKEKGVSRWIASVWSPPAPFKSPVQDTRGKVDEAETYLNMEFKDSFCEYYANALAYLRDHGCGTPVMISIQNEPNHPVPYDGSGFANKTDYQEVMRRMRHWLDAKNLKSVRLGGVEAAQPGDPSFMGDGSDHWKDLKAAPVDCAIAHTYGGAGWDHYQFSRAPIPKWMTEWCEISGHDEITAAVDSAAHISRDIVNDGVEYWFWWNSYAPNPNPGSADLVYGEPSAPKTTKAFRLLKKLFHEVTPDGSFKVRSFATSDSSIEVGLGADFSKPVNVVAFQSKSKYVILLTNTSSESKEIILKGIGNKPLKRFEISATTSSEEDMPDRGAITVTEGTSASFKVEPATIQILTGQSSATE